MTREEAILLLHDMKDTYDEIHENTNYEIGYEQMTALDMAIEALSADAVQGEWVDEDGNNVPLHKDGYPLRSCYCNQCHEWLVASDEYEVKGNFCPNCGARMKGGDDE